MPSVSRYTPISVTVPRDMSRALDEVCKKEIRKKSEVVTEALRLYFRSRGLGKPSWSLVMPSGDEKNAPVDYGAFNDEWGGENDKVYDRLER
jgi:hypothetical protein